LASVDRNARAHFGVGRPLTIASGDSGVTVEAVVFSPGTWVADSGIFPEPVRDVLNGAQVFTRLKIGPQRTGRHAAEVGWDEAEWARGSCLSGHISLCLVPAGDGAQAQDAAATSEVLPAIEVVAPGTAAKPARNRNAPRTARNIRRVFVYPTAPTPTAGSGLDVDKVAASVNAVGAGQIARTGSLNIADALQQQVRASSSATFPQPVSGPTSSFVVLSRPRIAGTRRDLRCTRTAVRINERSATP